MGPAFALGIQDAVTIDDFVILVFKKGKVIVSGKTFLQFLNESSGVLVGIDAHCQNLSFFLLLLCQNIFQFAELLGAVGSPLAAVKDQNEALFSPEVG